MTKREDHFIDDGSGLELLPETEARERQHNHLRQLTNWLRRDTLLGKRKKVRTDDDDDPTHRH